MSQSGHTRILALQTGTSSTETGLFEACALIWIKDIPRHGLIPLRNDSNTDDTCEMTTTDDLAERCNQMLIEGMDFPTIWESYLAKHKAVIGPPIQGYRNNEPVLSIPLFYRQTLIFFSTEGHFLVE